MLSRPPHEAPSWFVFSGFFYRDVFPHDPPRTSRRFCFSHDALWQGAGYTDKGETFKTHLPHKTLFSTTTKQKKQKQKKEIKNYRKYGHVIYTAFTHFLDLNYKHTSIFQLHTSSNLQSPFGSLFTTTPQNSALMPTTVLEGAHRAQTARNTRLGSGIGIYLQRSVVFLPSSH